MVAEADYHRRAAHYLGAVRDRSGIHRALVLRTAVPLPDAVLLAVRQRRMRAGIVLPGHVDPRGAADHPVRVRHAAVHPRVPADLLLLPRRLLPVVLAGTDGVRGARTACQVLGLDADLADEYEAHAARLDHAGHPDAHGPVHLAGRQRRDLRPSILQLGRTGEWLCLLRKSSVTPTTW